MAEAAMFSVASRLLSTVASPVFEKAYERVCSIWDAKDELGKLKRSMQTIQAVLLDAEKKQDSSAAVKDWIKRVRDVFYEADDLFDEVVTDDMLKQQMFKGDNKLLNKVRVSCSKLNPIVSGDSIAKKVKAIRKSLVEISTDMAPLEFVRCQHEAPVSGVRKGQDPGYFVDSKNVFGRKKDKKVILELLLHESDSDKPDAPFVIAIVGIGGMGKTTLAQLIYNHEEVEKEFEKKWFACISDTSDEKEVLGKIFQSICDKNYSGFTVSQLQAEIRKAMKGIEKFLLVLDDVWDEDHGRWQHRMSLLSNCSKGSKIIVTTRSLSVARGIGASKTHNLYGLSKDESWDLFKRVAFTPEQERDSRWTDLGREIVKKCADVPLAIRSIGSLLYTKTTIQEWEYFRDQELSLLGEQSGDFIMNTLKLSYEHLPSNLKHCFAYCALFPKDFLFEVQKLIHFWISQGYIKLHHEWQTVEQTGHSYFMDLFRRSFFQEERYWNGEICFCKMHDLIHDLAQYVAGEEICVLSRPSNLFMDSARHAGIFCKIEKSWEVLAQPLSISRVRSILIDVGEFGFHLTLDEQLTKFKFLRTLSLQKLGIQNVSSSIGELKHLRCVDLSHNAFSSLPNSMTNLLNLLILNLRGCEFLRALPDKFRKLINLRYLNTEFCIELKHMPPGIEDLTCLQYLSHFDVRKPVEGVQMSGIDVLARMQQLRGELCIRFHINNISDWDEDECWKLPVSLQKIMVDRYPGRRIPPFGNERDIVDPSLLPNLASLMLCNCSNLKYLGSISLLPNLKSLHLSQLWDLEYVLEEEGEGRDKHFCIALATHQFEDQHPSLNPFPSLSRLVIATCPKLKSIPLCPHLEDITIGDCNDITSFTDETLTSLRELYILACPNLMSLHLTSPHLQEIEISSCNGLLSFRVEALPVLLSLKFRNCKQLKDLHIAHLNSLMRLVIKACPELEVWDQDEDKRCFLDWVSLPNLRDLSVDSLPKHLTGHKIYGDYRIITMYPSKRRIK